MFMAHFIIIHDWYIFILMGLVKFYLNEALGKWFWGKWQQIPLIAAELLIDVAHFQKPETFFFLLCPLSMHFLSEYTWWVRRKKPFRSLLGKMHRKALCIESIKCDGGVWAWQEAVECWCARSCTNRSSLRSTEWYLGSKLFSSLKCQMEN